MGFKLRLINIAFVTHVLLIALVSPFLLITAVPVYWFGGKKRSDNYIHILGAFLSRHLLFTFGIRVDVRGIKNLPKSNNLCFISNHQGLADIPIIVGYIPKTVGFIAKKELGRIPFLNIWMGALGCVLIDRKNLRNSLHTIEKGIHHIEKGHPMVIFPEGTRSRNASLGNFKPGSFKLVTGSNALAVPVSISGSYKIVEERGIITASKIKLTIHPAIDVSTLSETEKSNLHQKVKEIIISGL
jgi:1-acyl-sn-glycerol-3-phosphate acyltransferase